MDRPYKIVRGFADDPEDLEKQDVGRSIVDLLTDRQEGCLIQILVDPITLVEKRMHDAGRNILKKFAVNYASGGQDSIYYSQICTPEAVAAHENQPVFILDNAFDDKLFYSQDWGMWRHIDKIGGQTYTFIGDPEAAYQEFRDAGYDFSELPFKKPTERSEREKRVNRIKKIMGELGIYHSYYNPKPAVSKHPRLSRLLSLLLRTKQ